MQTWLVVHMVLSKVELLLRIVRRLWLWGLWSVSRHIIRIDSSRNITRGISMRDSCSRGSFGKRLWSILKIAVLRRRMLNQKVSLILLKVWWPHVLFISLDMRRIAYLIDLSALRMINRRRTVTINSATTVSNTSNWLIISARLLRVSFFIFSLLILLKVSMSRTTFTPWLS